jgi:hypothetical protein
MIKPTIGRIVWYHPLNSTPEQQPLAAIIVYVWSDTCVNLGIFSPEGLADHVTSVSLYQGDGPKPYEQYAEWMPYQQGQAAKTEQLKAQLKDKV